jgi:hypothetical protein
LLDLPKSEAPLLPRHCFQLQLSSANFRNFSSKNLPKAFLFLNFFEDIPLDLTPLRVKDDNGRRMYWRGIFTGSGTGALPEMLSSTL